MKLYCLEIFDNSQKPARELCCAKDGSSFNSWQRPDVFKFISLSCKGIADGDSTGPNLLMEVHDKGYKFYTLQNLSNVIVILMSDEEYPKMVASNILKKVMDEFTTENPPSSYRSSTSTVSFPRLETYLSKYQNPSESDPIMKIQKELDETKEALYETIDAVLARGVKIDDLVAKSSELSMTSKMFYTKARQQNSCCTLM